MYFILLLCIFNQIITDSTNSKSRTEKGIKIIDNNIDFDNDKEMANYYNTYFSSVGGNMASKIQNS